MKFAPRVLILAAVAASISFAATTATWELNGYQDFLHGRMRWSLDYARRPLDSPAPQTQKRYSPPIRPRFGASPRRPTARFISVVEIAAGF